jgi:septum formation protein
MLLKRLLPEFTVLSPSIDEMPLPDEAPADLVFRLAEEKARTVSARHPDALVIGSDQLAVFENRIIGKPGNIKNAEKQLQQFSDQCVQFLTAVAVCCKETGFFACSTVSTDVGFRKLDNTQIRRYVAADKPVDCTGGFKSEARGSALLTHMRSDDPAAIIGLPLICLSGMLREAGIPIP